MSIRQEMHFQYGVLRVDATGEFSLEDAKRAFLEMLDAAAYYQAEKILLDGRNMKGSPAHIERFYYGYFAATETMSFIARCRMRQAPQFAYVLHEPLRDPGRYGEKVAVSRGMNIKVFESLEEAVEWLGLAPGNKPDL